MNRHTRAENPRLKELLAEISKDFGKVIRWRVLCHEQNATTDDDQIRLAEQVLAEAPMGSVGAGYAQWAKLHGAQDRDAPPYKPTGY